jgi:hypothetical protein
MRITGTEVFTAISAALLGLFCLYGWLSLQQMDRKSAEPAGPELRRPLVRYVRAPGVSDESWNQFLADHDLEDAL